MVSFVTTVKMSPNELWINGDEMVINHVFTSILQANADNLFLPSVETEKNIVLKG